MPNRKSINKIMAVRFLPDNMIVFNNTFLIPKFGPRIGPLTNKKNANQKIWWWRGDRPFQSPASSPLAFTRWQINNFRRRVKSAKLHVVWGSQRSSRRQSADFVKRARVLWLRRNGTARADQKWSPDQKTKPNSRNFSSEPTEISNKIFDLWSLINWVEGTKGLHAYQCATIITMETASVLSPPPSVLEADSSVCASDPRNLRRGLGTRRFLTFFGWELTRSPAHPSSISCNWLWANGRNWIWNSTS